MMTHYLTEIKSAGAGALYCRRQCTQVPGGVTRVHTPRRAPVYIGAFPARRISLTLIGHRVYVGGSAGCADWSCMDSAVDILPDGFRIDLYKGRRSEESQRDALCLCPLMLVIRTRMGGARVSQTCLARALFDVHQDHPHLGASPHILDGGQGRQFRMRSTVARTFRLHLGCSSMIPRLLE